MSHDFYFLWIDDDKSRQKAAENLEAIIDVEVNFQLSDHELASRISEILRNRTPDLVIVDHKLNWAVGTLHNPSKVSGATAAELIKDLHPEVPVVCVTQVDVETEITHAQRSVYDYIVRAEDLTHQSQIILSIAKGFKRINAKPPKSQQDLLQLLDCPDADRSRLIQVLPRDISAFKPDGYASVLWRWTAGVLFSRPGFLYDSLWAATLVGAKEAFFEKAQEKLTPALYRGVFANDVDKRWWGSKILELLYKIDAAGKERDPRLLGRIYFEIPKDAHSECREICGDEIPDTVAYTDVTNKRRIQISVRYTQIHPHFQKLLFFEDIRMIKEK